MHVVAMVESEKCVHECSGSECQREVMVHFATRDMLVMNSYVSISFY